MKPLGLYIHIPFCRSKCLYCDFCSIPTQRQQSHEDYVDALCKDLAARAADCTEHTVDSVYLGGGTPTLLPPTLLSKILHTVFRCYTVATDAEISIECNPATASRDALRALHRSGFNRISIGLQSANEQELRALGRLHSFEDFERTLTDARAAGFCNVSADLMMGIPHQTPKSYLQTLERLIALTPEHISAYGLTVEPDTPFGKMGERLILPDEEASRQMFFEGLEVMRGKGYLQYEISNFAKKGYECRHNLKYWNCEEYLGFGPAAYSDFGGKRFGNTRDLSAYTEGKFILAECEQPSERERISEYVMLRMRLAEGIDTKRFEKKFKTSFNALFANSLKNYEKGGFVCRTPDGWTFTPEGFYVSNTVLAELLDFSQ